jgi:hypothetical protein
MAMEGLTMRLLGCAVSIEMFKQLLAVTFLTLPLIATPSSGYTGGEPSIAPDGSVGIYLSVFSQDGEPIDYSHLMTFTAAGSGAGYLTISVMSEINDHTGDASYKIDVDGSGTWPNEQIPITLGQPWTVLLAASAASYVVPPPHTTVAGVRLGAQIQAFSTSGVAVPITALSAPEPATLCITGLALVLLLNYKRFILPGRNHRI